MTIASTDTDHAADRSRDDAPVLLVGAARAVGKPLDLHRAAGGRRRGAVRLS